jgi:S-adenosylmethionine/arginine decarboxylase-like enzyme
MNWGYHLVLDIARCAPKSIRCAKNIEGFAKTLVKDIDMVAYGSPQIVMFGTGNKKGYTLVQLIETSNICAHFVEETNDIYLDVFSCKNFDPKVVEEVVKKYFDPETMRGHLLTRQAGTGQLCLTPSSKS